MFNIQSFFVLLYATQTYSFSLCFFDQRASIALAQMYSQFLKPDIDKSKGKRRKEIKCSHSVFPLHPVYPAGNEDVSGIWIRYFYEGSKLGSGDGKLFHVPLEEASSETIFLELSRRGIDLIRYTPRS